MITTQKRAKIEINKSVSSNTELWENYIETRDINLRNKLVELNLSLARKLAHSTHNKNPNVPYEDIEQQAFIALIFCVESFQPDKGYRFSTYAVPAIKGRLMNFIRDKTSLIKVPRKILNKISVSKRELISNSDYKEAQDSVKSCRYVKELVGNELIFYHDDNTETENFIAKSSLKIENETDFEDIKLILNKKKITPLDIIKFRNSSKRVKIELKNFL